MSKLVPKYTMWEAMNAALMGVQRALDEIRTLARTPGPAGKDGRDGVSYDGIEEEIKDRGRWLVRRHKLNGVVVSEQEFQLGTMIYRGVFKEGHPYLCGDTVSYGGSTWHCNADRPAGKPDAAGDSWTLSNKRGRDGKDGMLKDPPKPGPVKVG